jgi:guanylate kinase
VRKGALLVLAGTSGAGKTTLAREYLARHPDVLWSVSWNTRPQRAEEENDRDYHFVTRAEFERERDAGGFLEWFQVYDDLKGTPKAPVVDALAAGRDVLVEVDIQGAHAIRALMPDACLVFVRAPSREEQRRRLDKRAGDAHDAIERRLARAAAEEEVGSAEFDAVVVNDDVERAVAELAAILEAHRAAGS